MCDETNSRPRPIDTRWTPIAALLALVLLSCGCASSSSTQKPTKPADAEASAARSQAPDNSPFGRLHQALRTRSVVLQTCYKKGKLPTRAAGTVLLQFDPAGQLVAAQPGGIDQTPDLLSACVAERLERFTDAGLADRAFAVAFTYDGRSGEGRWAAPSSLAAWTRQQDETLWKVYERLFKLKSPAVQSCWEAELARHPQAGGGVRLKFRLANDQIQSLHTLEDKVDSGPFLACLRSVFTGVAVPPGESGKSIEKYYLFAPEQ